MTVREDGHWPHDQDGRFRCCGVEEIGQPYIWQCEAPTCLHRNRDILGTDTLAVPGDACDPIGQPWVCTQHRIHHAHLDCWEADTGWKSRPPVEVEFVAYGTPEWDESEKMLEKQRRAGG